MFEMNDIAIHDPFNRFDDHADINADLDPTRGVWVLRHPVEVYGMAYEDWRDGLLKLVETGNIPPLGVDRGASPVI